MNFGSYENRHPGDKGMSCPEEDLKTGRYEKMRRDDHMKTYVHHTYEKYVERPAVREHISPRGMSTLAWVALALGPSLHGSGASPRSTPPQGLAGTWGRKAGALATWRLPAH